MNCCNSSEDPNYRQIGTMTIKMCIY